MIGSVVTIVNAKLCRDPSTNVVVRRNEKVDTDVCVIVTHSQLVVTVDILNVT